MAKSRELHASDMAYQHPIGDDHPFPKTHALAQAEGLEQLEILNLYEGALIRLFVRAPDMVFKLQGDPGSAIDRQRFDYYTHITLAAAAPEKLVGTIKDHIRKATNT